MRTYRNVGAQPLPVAWCVTLGHWPGQAHAVGAPSAQGDAFEGFEIPAIEADHSVTIQPGGLLTVDDTQLNGDVIDALLIAEGMVVE